MRISEYLTLEEATKSQTAVRLGIDNTPTEEEVERMKYVAINIFDPTRKYVGGPLHASSFFRCQALNNVTPGSSPTSQHRSGEAIDIDCDTFGFGNNSQVYEWISKNLEFDQIIMEYPDVTGKPAWIHVSLKKNNNRGQQLVKLQSGYVPYNSWKVGQV